MPMVQADAGQIDQIVHNLVINATQAMPEGGFIAADIRFRDVDSADGLPLADGRYVEVSIQDSGQGVPPELLARVFDPFFSTKEKGSGLGLAVCHSIIRNHGGSITMESVTGQGTTVRFLLPAVEGGSVAVDAGLEEIPLGLRVLVLDDDQGVLRALERAFRELGAELVGAPEGVEAAQRYAEAMQAGAPFDLVIVDLTVPGGVGGKDALKLIRQHDPRALVYVSSGYSDNPIMAQHREHGFDGVLPKPFSFPELERILGGLASG